MKKNKILKSTFLIIILTCISSCYAQNIDIEKMLKHKIWIPTLYNDVLSSESRDTYYKYAPYYLEHPTKEFSDPHFSDYKIIKWYESDSWEPIKLSFKERKEFYSYGKTIESFVIGQHEYDIVKKVKNKMIINISEDNLKTNKYADFELNIGFEKLEGKKNISLIFEFDGDYVDIYVNDKKHFFATFCKYDISTYNQLIDLINTNECEPWMIEYPKRANGSIDFVSSK